MTPWTNPIRRMALAALPALCWAAPAAASPAMESVVMDDAQTVYATPEQLDQTLGEMKALGVDRLRVTVLWRLVAPAPDQKERPAFGPGGPASPSGYAPESWDRYDAIVRTAQKHGVSLLFTIAGPSPLWATGRPERRDIEDTYEPNPGDFRAFVEAVGTRYSGGYRDEVRGDPPPPPQGGLLPGSSPPPPPPPQGEVLPRVDAWSIWNEPNHPGWLNPQWLPDPRAATLPLVPTSPKVYRGLVDAGWAGLEASGHAGDLVMLGETAPRGHPHKGLTRAIRPLEFIRELYCLDRRLRPLQGEEARIRDCPGTRAAFVDRHPGLFRANAWAHHPYALEQAPDDTDPHLDNVVLADMDRLVRTLDRIQRTHGQSRRFPIWLTEYGYQTDPPDPTIGVSWRRQAAYLNHADYIAYRNPRVASTAQFLLVDDGPLRQFPASDPRYWGTFQSGLKTGEGHHKPAYQSYQRVVHASPSRIRRGRTVRIFGQLRSAPDGRRLTARLEFRRLGVRRFGRVGRRATTNPRGFMTVRTRPRRSGYYRLVWADPETGRDVPTRSVKVSVRRR